MHKVYMIHEDARLQRVLNQTYDELLAAVKVRNPKATSLIDDDEYCMLHDLLALLRLGHIKVSNSDGDRGLSLMVEILEEKNSIGD